jgi:sigma-B regulation protein RsbU (phosphoserine phosphatase)
MTAGADEYLLKPFDPAELRLRVRAGLRIIELEHALASQNLKLEAAYNSLEEAVQAASRVQRHLLPEQDYLDELEQRTGISMAYEFIVCENLGGDIIGVQEPEDGKVALFLADVSGHGIAASMAAVSLNSFIRTYLRGSYEPHDLITQANRFCCDEFPAEVYATMVYMVIEPAARSMQLVVAGHPPVLKLNGAGEVSEFTSTIPPLGLFNAVPGPEAVVSLPIEAGDRLVAYTDGVIETRNAAGIFFAKEWLTNSIVKAALTEERTVPERIVADLNAWRGPETPVEDDITIMALRMLR